MAGPLVTKAASTIILFSAVMIASPPGCKAAMPLILYFLNCAPAASTSAAVLNRDSGTSQLRFVNYAISLSPCVRRG
jgi:hypothetical protein